MDLEDKILYLVKGGLNSFFPILIFQTILRNFHLRAPAETPGSKENSSTKAPFESGERDL